MDAGWFVNAATVETVKSLHEPTLEVNALDDVLLDKPLVSDIASVLISEC